MGPVLIAYGLGKGKDYSGVLKYIQRHDHIELGQSCHVIKTLKRIDEVLPDVLAVAPPGAKIFVTELSALFLTSEPLAKQRAWLRGLVK